MSDTELTSSTDEPVIPRRSEVGFLDFALVLLRRKRLLLGIPLVVAVLTAVITMFMPNVYTATARILPPPQSQSTATMMLNQLAGLTGLGAGTLGVKNPNDLYVGMLKSRTVADNLIQRFRLQQLYKQDTMVDTRRVLANRTQLRAGRDAIIAIAVEDEDPKRASALSNAYVEELIKLTETLAVTEASQRRLFFEKQVKQVRRGLEDAELAMRRTQEETGLISLTDQGKAIIEATARVRAQIAAKEVQLGAMRTFATDTYPDYVRGQQELKGLRAQLAKLERATEAAEGNVLLATKDVPEAGLEYMRRLRDVKYYEGMFELLSQQLELARIDEAKEASVVQILDPAVAPDKKTKPKRLLLTVLSAFVAVVISLVSAFVVEAFQNAQHQPELRERLHQLKEQSRWR